MTGSFAVNSNVASHVPSALKPRTEFHRTRAASFGGDASAEMKGSAAGNGVRFSELSSAATQAVYLVDAIRPGSSLHCKCNVTHSLIDCPNTVKALRDV
jgi:hypothetical protein